jgi:1-pyrroline-5-carboxylate dehydrogenase
MTLFTGSSKVAEMLARDLHGRIKIEDAGFDWKVLGPDVQEMDYVAWTCDQDAYAYSGQKCSAQSILFMHENWSKAGLIDKLASLAARRRLIDLTIGPNLTITNEMYQSHVDRLLLIPGAKLLFGGLLDNHSIPPVYGSFKPTAVQVWIRSLP